MKLNLVSVSIASLPGEEMMQWFMWIAVILFFATILIPRGRQLWKKFTAPSLPDVVAQTIFDELQVFIEHSQKFPEPDLQQQVRPVGVVCLTQDTGLVWKLVWDARYEGWNAARVLIECQPLQHRKLRKEVKASLSALLRKNDSLIRRVSEIY